MRYGLVIDVAAPDTRQQVHALLDALGARLTFVECAQEAGEPLAICQRATLTANPAIDVMIVININGDTDTNVRDRIQERLGAQPFIIMNYFGDARTRAWLRWQGIGFAYKQLSCLQTVAFRARDTVPATLTFTPVPVPYPEFSGQKFL
jgi:hypothetical protein